MAGAAADPAGNGSLTLYNRIKKSPIVGMTSMISGIMIHAIQNTIEDIKKSLIAVIMKSTNFLTDNLRLRKYIEIQYYRTAIKEYSRNDRMCKEIYLVSK